ncbi:hypothetical protein [Kosmotoga pacifica]|uniref:Uncharacterized protein n=1 Tax=Kosmotoga pacifica TaxID=1330330 RepID=A0A0G2ZDV6_9BACT|nr:hypothetical protein [Kosmotoga pacifica]AKI97744.1 hypothetical protein IX53_07880 [Kosmotoga pacifica]
MRKSGLVLPLSVILMVFISLMALTLLNTTSQKMELLFNRINKAELQLYAGNVFFTNYSYIQKKFMDNSSLVLSNYPEYTKAATTPAFYKEFLKSFSSDTLENQGWKELFNEFSDSVFYIPGANLEALFSRLAKGLDVKLVMIPHKNFPSTLLTVVRVKSKKATTYLWGLVGSKYFSNWSRFELKSNTTAMWFPGSVLYGPTFFGSAGVGNGGLRAVMTIPPDESNINAYGPVFNGEVWYETWDFSLQLNPALEKPRKQIRVDQDGDGKYETNLGNKNYVVYNTGDATWIYVDGFKNVIEANTITTKGSYLYVNGSVKDFLPNGYSDDFNAKYLPWFLPGGVRKVDQDMMARLETRFSEMETYYTQNFSNITHLEDILDASYHATSGLQESYVSNGIKFEDTTRSLGTGSSISETETIENITGTIDINDVLLSIVPEVRTWLNSKNNYILSVKKQIGVPLNTNPLTEAQVQKWLEYDAIINFPNTTVVTSQKKTITQLQQTGSTTVKDFASSVSVSADVLTGSEVETLLATSMNLSPLKEYSVLKISWPREITIGGSGQFRQRTRTATREAIEYIETTKNVKVTLKWWKWRYKKGKWIKRTKTYYTSKNFTVTVPVKVKTWGDWVYGDWSDWEILSGYSSKKGSTYNASVDYYVITDPKEFDKQSFDSVVTYKVNSEDELIYPSFTATPVMLTHKGLMIVDNNISIGGSGIKYGVGKTLGREATVIEGKFTILSKNGNIATNGDIIYHDLLSDSTFMSYVDQPGEAFDPDYDPNDSAYAVSLDDMLNLVAANGNIYLPYAATYADRMRIKNIKLTSNIFAFGKGNRGEINIEKYYKYNVNMGYRHIFGTMVSRDNSAAGTSGWYGESYGFRSRNYYDERLYGNEDMPFGTPESNLLQAMGIGMK